MLNLSVSCRLKNNMADKSPQDSSEASKQFLGLVGEYWAISHLSGKPLTHVVFPGLLLSTITFGHAAQQVGGAKSAAVAVTEVAEEPKSATTPATSSPSGKPVMSPANAGAKNDSGVDQGLGRWREGHRVENMYAQLSILESERFSASLNNGERSLIVLENLALQRIAEAMKIDSSDSRWVISGKITEFRDHNYLWIERATRAAKIADQ
jgi:hypothetical protein